MRLDALLKALDARLNKDQSGRITRPDRLNSFMDLINIKMFNIKAGLPEEYVPGQAIPAQALDVTSQISEDLSFCIVRKNHEHVTANGILKPVDFVRMSYMHTVYSVAGKTIRKKVQVIFGNEWSNTMSSSLRRPTKRNPVAILEGGKFYITPEDIHVAFSYYRLPKKPFFDYVIVNDEPKYLLPGAFHNGSNPEMPAGSPSRSIELEWPESLHPAFLDMLTEEFSSNIKDEAANADAWRHKMTGK